MLLAEDKQIDIFVASKIGSLKHIKYHTDLSKNSKKCIENWIPIKSLQKDDSITCMEWGNEDQTEILIGQKNNQIKTYSTVLGFVKSYTADFGTGNIVGLGRYKRRLIAAMGSGVVKVWSKKEETIIDTGGKLDQMKLCPDDPTLFATGGEENDLKIWRIGEPAPIFSAKNLAHDWLQLRRPVWVTGVTFLEKGGNVAAVCSRHGYVRLYDTRAQRRPVINVDFPNMAATCIVPSFTDRNVLVGFGRGQLHQVDLRKGKPDKGFKGAAGAITSIAIANDNANDRIVISGSADRHLRVHGFENKELRYKQYLTSKLSCILAQTKSVTPFLHLDQAMKEEEVKENNDMDELFESMDTVGGPPKRKEKLPLQPGKKIKPSLEGSTIDLGVSSSGEEGENEEDAIKKLLLSTEKKKKRMEKKKKQKKAKSVFHNA